ncbi:MAG: protease modulator HflC [Alphaproteobacteria bacterium]|nr:protease modulator HflC [Alphaproteobacteria bacterium]
MKPIVLGGLVAAVAAVVLVSQSLFVVEQTQQALVLQFGEPRRVIKDPGLKFKVPFVQQVITYDSRMLDVDPPPESIILVDQSRLVADSYARYRIVEPLIFYQTVNNEVNARGRLNGIINSSMRRVLGGYTLSALLSPERDRIMSEIQVEVNEGSRRFGIEIVDVRLRRADLPQETSSSVFDRMRSEREREAREFRAQGQEAAQRIRSAAERERTVLLAEAQREAQVARGEGDAQAIRIYAEAFGRNPEFFSFYRSMQAYREALGNGDTTMVLSPDHDFFRYFGGTNGLTAPSAAPRN